jgi:mono/diheme cytochrome c family protein
MKRILLCAVLLVFAVGRSLFAVEDADPDSVLNRLVFDSLTKQYDAKLNEKKANFVFLVTNTWTNEITVDRVQTSCGCTVASLPANPWHIAPGAHGEVDATVNLEGKGAGLLQKTITLYLSTHANYLGTRVATVKVNIPTAPPPTSLTAEERKAAMQKAQADPQQIFKDPKCADCHVNQGRNAWGSRLYAADCGICHDSPNRATFVPDLHTLKTPTSFAYWKTIISQGKPHTMMPAFADNAGGPLNDEQVHSIAEYLARNIPNHAAP